MSAPSAAEHRRFVNTLARLRQAVIALHLAVRTGQPDTAVDRAREARDVLRHLSDEDIHRHARHARQTLTEETQ